MKNILKAFLYGAVTAFGIQAGKDAFGKLKDPCNKAKIKKKFTKIKDFFSKDEES